MGKESFVGVLLVRATEIVEYDSIALFKCGKVREIKGSQGRLEHWPLNRKFYTWSWDCDCHHLYHFFIPVHQKKAFNLHELNKLHLNCSVEELA